MSQFELVNFSDPESLAVGVAERWLNVLSARAAGNTPYCIGLLGGRITRDFYHNFTVLTKHRGGRFDGVHFFWGDERCVPPEHTESNFALANEFLLQPLDIAEGQIHRIRGEEPPEFAAAEAEAELRRFAPLNAAGQPVLDLIFLGMGEDGHVASLFPGEAEEIMAVPAVYRAVTASKPPPRRITLGYAAIAAARQVWVLASGAGKERALGESLKADGGTPLARVLQMQEHTVIFTDIKMEPTAN